MIRYYCSGFDINNAFGHGLGEMFRNEIKDNKSIVYIPGGADKIQKVRDKHFPAFRDHFKRIGIHFDRSVIINPEMSCKEAQKAVREASFVMLMGGDPFNQKEMCNKLGLLDELKKYDGVMVGFSAGAMLMSKYIIITPCSEEYPDFHIEGGLNFDELSIYPHNNTSSEEYPDELVAGDEKYNKSDLIKVANEYGKFYLLQDYQRDDGMFDISIIKSTDGNVEYYIENSGKVWEVNNGINLVSTTI